MQKPTTGQMLSRILKQSVPVFNHKLQVTSCRSQVAGKSGTKYSVELREKWDEVFGKGWAGREIRWKGSGDWKMNQVMMRAP